MRLETIRIQNFRSFKDETIHLDDYTCLVGSNGTGKSTVLSALNVFFRNTGSSPTNVLNLTEEDFHHKNTSEPVKITLTFKDLSEEAKGKEKGFECYCRQDKLTVFSKAEWKNGSAEVKQYGARHVMKDFAPFFNAMEDKTKKVGDLKKIYESIKKIVHELPDEKTKGGMSDALRSYEEMHPEQCELLDSENLFYGWSKGTNRLSEYVQWVYVPAVKDASTEQGEEKKTALGQLLQRTIRSKVNFEESIAELKAQLEKQYEGIIESEKEALSDLQNSIHKRLQEWASPAASLYLDWHYDPDKSLVINKPLARISIGEDSFVGEVARLGHGMQRSFLLAILQELAETHSGEARPTLLLGFEEPELYQHPPQAQHIASLLEGLATTVESQTQVMVTTHSPYFVSGKGFEGIRLFRKHFESENGFTGVKSATYENIDNLLTNAGCTTARPSELMAKIEQIMHPSLRELFFSRVPVLVEGLEDIAFIATNLQLRDRWKDFRKLGCHFVVCGGKSAIMKPLAITIALGIPSFIVFDSDADNTKHRSLTQKENSCLLRLSGLTEFDPFPDKDLCEENVVMWRTNIADVVHADVGDEAWNKAEANVRKEIEYYRDKKSKNKLLISAVFERLAREGLFSQSLDMVSDSILDFAQSATLPSG